MKIVAVFLNLSFMFCFYVPVSAQFSNKENPNCNPNYAKLLIDRQISESQSLEESDKRIKILIRAADFLWDIDQENARKYFAEAFQTAENFIRKKVTRRKTRMI
jgi:hypothetical protein